MDRVDKIMGDIMESGRAGAFEVTSRFKKQISTDCLRYSNGGWLHKHQDVPPVHFNWWNITHQEVVRFVKKNLKTYKGLCDAK